ncbi:MAG TPA: biopolymer transporter ExbD [Thermoanaerobaculia bacterium]|nr:biopolymer transporter ExbD [Thermoanaerobaculia bacterium]
MRIERETNVSDEIPTASMADIAFLLIIYFMITTTFAATQGLDFQLPKEQDDTPLVEKEESVLIEIAASGQLIVDGRPMELGDVLEYLKPKLERDALKPVIIRPDPDSAYRHMVDVFDELRQSEDKIGILVRNISIPTQREIEAFWY